MLSFLGRVFVERNVADLPTTELVGALDDELYALNERFPTTAQAYLDDWAAPERGWLRKYDPPGSDEPRYDISPVDDSRSWLARLERDARHFCVEHREVRSRNLGTNLVPARVTVQSFERLCMILGPPPTSTCSTT